MRIVGGELGGRLLEAPKDARTRPMLEKTRAAVFNILGLRVAGVRVLDAFAGTGSLGLEALSRGAAHATFVERDRVSFRCLERNVAALGVGARSAIRREPIERVVESLEPESFELAFLDPPYVEVEDPIRRPRALALAREIATRVLVPSGALVLHFPSGALGADALATIGAVVETARDYGRNAIAILRRG
ncbi:MAG TPA: RsmD family RNA methyltransferase [Planctomycetota bacterium]|nr:RsmD family RNA methyltransferase [Planctomycetota bacterium]